MKAIEKATHINAPYFRTFDVNIHDLLTMLTPYRITEIDTISHLSPDPSLFIPDI